MSRAAASMPGAALHAWRAQLASLVDVARLGAQFPEASRWRALLEVLGRDGPRGKPLSLARSPVWGLPTARALANLHRLQFVAREFWKKHRARPTAHARAFSMSVAAVELPPVAEVHVRLVARGKPNRFVLSHERLDGCAVRFTVQLAQHKGGHVHLGRDNLARPSDQLVAAVKRAGSADARGLHLALTALPGLEVTEVLRGQLGPFVSSLWPAPAPLPLDVRALRQVVDAQATGGAVLSVSLERLGVDVTTASEQDPWVAPMDPVPGQRIARERRLVCTPALEAPLRALVAQTGRAVLVRSR